MTVKFALVASCFLFSQAMFTVAQDRKPIAIPERTMAARLQTFATPAFSTPASASRCSSALAVVHIIVDGDGHVSSADYLSGYDDLKEPALAAVRRWTYKPRLIDGQPVLVDTKASIFYLGDGTSMPMYVPDGKGGTKGGNIIPLPPGCGQGPQINRD